MAILVEDGLHPNGMDLVMGDHKVNGRALAHAAPRHIPGPGDVAFGFDFDTVIELNAEKMAEVTKLLDSATASGIDPRTVVPKFDPRKNPEWFDYVVYNRPLVARPSALAIDPTQVPVARIRWSEHLRIPLVDLNKRADELFAGREARGQSH